MRFLRVGGRADDLETDIPLVDTGPMPICHIPIIGETGEKGDFYSEFYVNAEGIIPACYEEYSAHRKTAVGNVMENSIPQIMLHHPHAVNFLDEEKSFNFHMQAVGRQKEILEQAKEGSRK